MKRILIVSGDFPYPPNHGGRVDIWGRILSLVNSGYYVDLICTVTVEQYPSEDEITHVKNYVNELVIVERNKNLFNLFALSPYQYVSRKKLIGLDSNYFKKEYHFLILEGEYVLSILDNKALKFNTTLLRVHNDEITYMKSLANSTKNLLRKLYYNLEAFKLKKLNERYSNRISNYLFISYDEMQRFKVKTKLDNYMFLPPSIDVTELKPITVRSKSVLFIGSLFMENNKEGLIWYLKNVHNKVKKCIGYNFIIAGNSRGENLKWLEDIIKRDDRIQFIDSPESLNEIYIKSCIFINPMLNGAGVKLKTIEAIKNGLPVVSTSIGAEGTGLINEESILIRDNPIHFAEAINNLLENEEIRVRIFNNASNYLHTNYNQKRLLKEYLDKIEDEYN